jgi:hypothetical protein
LSSLLSAAVMPPTVVDVGRVSVGGITAADKSDDKLPNQMFSIDLTQDNERESQ